MINKSAPHTEKILNSISGIYNTLHYFDFIENKCYEVYAIDQVSQLFHKFNGTVDIQTLIHTILDNVTAPEYKKSVFEFTDFSTIEQRLKGKKVLSFEFIGTIHGWTRASFIPAGYDKDGHLEQIIFATRIVQDDREKEQKLLALADIDEKTGFYNRRAFERDGDKFEAEGLPENLTVISFDINEIRNANEDIGFEAGDELVKGASDCIRKIFGSKGKIYRLGGDKFNAIIQCDFKELVALFGEFNSITANWKGEKVERLTISKGCAAHPEFPDMSFTDLLKRSERRMHQEKELYYKNKGKESTSLISDNESIAQIMQQSGMGLFTLEYDEKNTPKMQMDDYIKSFMGFSSDATPEQIYKQWIAGIHPDYVDSVFAGMEKIIIGNLAEVQYQWFHPKAGLTYVRSSGFRDPSFTNGIRITGFFQNVSNMVHMAKDALTGLYTKENFFRRAEEILAKNPDKHFKIFVSDIENFKSLNEKYGIEASDKLLQYLAKSLKKFAPNLVLSGRIGVDTFVCLQEKIVIHSREEGRGLEQEILKDAPIQNFTWKHGFYYTDYERNVSIQTMCDRAIAALESIKGDYTISCALYDKKLAEKNKKEQQILENMESALKNNEFEVYLQPKYNLHTEKTGGAEALIRWVHPEIGFMIPGDFIPVFEKNGFITNVDKFVLVEVCKVLRRWLDQDKPVVPISVNLSRRDFDQYTLAEEIIATVDSYKIPHEYIHFELTESAFSDNPEHIANTIETLHSNGFVIELDDFGSGYSSLTSLSEIEFDILKLDMSIIKNDNPSSSRNVLDMCSHIMKKMNLKSVAEGVENEKQLQRIKDIGCDYIQGYFFSKPLPIKEFEEYIKKDN